MKGPTPWQPEMPALWWLSQPNYVRYMLRELTCIWVGAWVGMAIVGLIRLRQGPEAWEGFLGALGSAPGIVFQIVALLFVLYHTVSWFRLAPSTMPIWIGETRVPSGWIELAHYAAWILASLLILYLVGV
ncbi:MULTISPECIES: fumarate reductase subunit C [unclassified Wenzhouxiangella]|uniref:fumarate reductase subunit C n=1 Tax=unclassified Wenzhouxiangella TaxID=2613841 RepID=UPI000E325518|nr:MULTISPECIES: fumarate reductase subunit C [unclassified Wenzhouxiangella]RFF26677.1 fumarate reductase subunit C [Wenzhouxiangella sp. 15181]RFP67572.1 fumarate reductase subunit C [Wenzhouxiangella sp. 15190]